MASPEGARQISGISAPPREAPTRRPIPKRKVETAPGSPKPEEHPNKKALITRLVGALVAIAGVGGPALNHHLTNETEISPPAIARDIASIPGFYWNFGKSAVEDITRLFNRKIEVPPTVFDFSKNTAIATTQNTIGVPPEEIGQFNQDIKPPTPESLTRLQASPETTVNYYTSNEPFLELPLPFEVPPNADIKVGKKFTRQEGYEITINGLPKDTIIYAPIGGRYSFSQTINYSGISTFAFIVFKDQEGYYRNLIFQFGASRSLIDEAVPKPGEKFDWFTGGVEVNAGQPIFVLDAKDARGNWLSNQLAISLSPSASKAKGENLLDKDGRPLFVYSPLTIKTIDNKAVSIIK